MPGRIGIHQSHFAAVGTAIGVDGDELRAALARLVLDLPKVDVGDGGVRAPVDDVAAIDRGLGVDHRAGAERHVAAGRAGGGADRAVQQARTEAMEEPPVEACIHELAHRAGIAVGQDGLWPVFGGRDLLEPAGDFADGVGPGDALELPVPLLAGAAQGVEQTLGVVDAIEIAGDLLAQEAAREGMVAVAAELDGSAARASTVTTMPQVSGQSCGQTAFTVTNFCRIPFPHWREVKGIIRAVRSSTAGSGPSPSAARPSRERSGRS